MTLRSDRVHRQACGDLTAGVDSGTIRQDLEPSRTGRLGSAPDLRIRAALAAAVLGFASVGPPGALAAVRHTEPDPAATVPSPARPTSPEADGPRPQPGPDATSPPLDHDVPLVDPDDLTVASDAHDRPAPGPAAGPATPSPAQAPPTTPSDAASPAAPPPSVPSPPLPSAPPVAPPSVPSPRLPSAPPVAPPAAAPPAAASPTPAPPLPTLTPAHTPVIVSVAQPRSIPNVVDAPPSLDAATVPAATPASSPAPIPTAPGATPASSPAPVTTTAATPASTPAAIATAAVRRGDRFHVVAPGESLWSIAASVVGRDATTRQIAREVDRLWGLNEARMRTGDPDVLMVGIRLRLR